jgi:hypothetical protein
MRMPVAFPEEIALNRVGRKVMVPFDNDRVVALRDGFSLPGCFHIGPFQLS